MGEPHDGIVELDPDRRGRVRLSTERSTTLRVLRRLTLRVLVVDLHLQPAVGERYRLEVEGASFEGTLGDEGLIEVRLPAGTRTGTLTVAPSQRTGRPTTRELRFAAWKPFQEVEGVQVRLNQLGFGGEEPSGEADPETKAAVRAFERWVGLAPTGDPASPETQDALRALFEEESFGEELDAVTLVPPADAELWMTVVPAGERPLTTDAEGLTERGRRVRGLLERLDDVLVLPDGAAYFLSGSEVIRYVVGRGSEPEDPRKLEAVWSGWPADWPFVQAAVYDEVSARALFFRGSRYLTAAPGGAVEDGPRPIAEGFPGLPKAFTRDLDVVVSQRRKLYFFKGADFVRYTPGKGPDPGFPKPIAGSWGRGWPAHFAEGSLCGGALWPNRKLYFFKGAEFVRCTPGLGVIADRRHRRSDGGSDSGSAEGSAEPAAAQDEDEKGVQPYPMRTALGFALEEVNVLRLDRTRTPREVCWRLTLCDADCPRQGVFFNFDSAVFIPDAETDIGLSVVLQALEHLEEHPGRTLHLAGHTDTMGSVEYNLPLSDSRAHAVLAILEGDAAAFVRATRRYNNERADVPKMLRYCGRRRGWAVDPGDSPAETERFQRSYNRRARPGAALAEDGHLGPRTLDAAVRAFQERYNETCRGRPRVRVDGTVGGETRAAYFAIIQDQLARKAGAHARASHAALRPGATP